MKGRALLRTAPGGATVIDDTYNASPETVLNLIGTLASLEAREKVLVLGPFSELEEGLAESLEIIAPHLRPPLTEVWLHDPARQGLAEHLGAAARELPLRERDRPGAVFGFKASRSAHLERAVEGMLGTGVACRLATCGLLKHCTDCERLRQG